MKLSIIMAVHNMEKYVEKALNAIFHQSFRDFEVICILDDCTDKSKELIERYPVQIYECNYHQPGLTRNVGLEHAKGDWIWCLDADDWLTCDESFAMIVNELSDDIDMLRINLYATKTCWTSQYISTTLWSNVIKRASLEKYGLKFHNKFYDEDAVLLNQCLNQCNFKMKIWDNQLPVYCYNFPREGSIAFNRRTDYYNLSWLVFTGCGKTQYCHTHPGCVDLDESAFWDGAQNNVKMCANVASYFMKQYYTVFASATIALLEEYQKRNMRINLILPLPEMKNEIIARISARGDTVWAETLNQAWDKYYTPLATHPAINKIIYLKPGQYLSDIMPELLSIHEAN